MWTKVYHVNRLALSEFGMMAATRRDFLVGVAA
jgi:hypothetical protein